MIEFFYCVQKKSLRKKKNTLSEQTNNGVSNGWLEKQDTR